jgi:hypothetical protein
VGAAAFFSTGTPNSSKTHARRCRELRHRSFAKVAGNFLCPYGNGSLFVVFRDQPAPNTATSGLGKIFRSLAGWVPNKFLRSGATDIPQTHLLVGTFGPRVRNYAGTATYVQEFDQPAIPTGKVMLDLGRVKEGASVSLNGVDFGSLWKAPFAMDVTKALRPGKNRLEVKVAYVWANLLIADAGLPESKRVSWVTYNPYKAGDRPPAIGNARPCPVADARRGQWKIRGSQPKTRRRGYWQTPVESFVLCKSVRTVAAVQV